MGLLCIGAGLQWKAFKEELSLMAASSVQRLVAVPLVGWATASVFGLGAVESGVLILFAALPTAQSCYVMTASMRGNAATVARHHCPDVGFDGDAFCLVRVCSCAAGRKSLTTRE